MEDLNEAGGVYAVMNELAKKDLLNLDVMTVSGKTMRENIEGCYNTDPSVIRPIEDPYMPNGGIAVLKGNIAPDTGIVKRSAVLPEMMQHEGPARVFDCEEDAIAAITGGKIGDHFLILGLVVQEDADAAAADLIHQIGRVLLAEDDIAERKSPVIHSQNSPPLIRQRHRRAQRFHSRRGSWQ